MKKFKKMGVALCGLLAAGLITVGVSAPAQAAPKNYVTSISAVKVAGKTVKKNATYKMYVGDTAKIKASVKVKGSASKKVTFSSSKKSIATVNASGTLSAKKAGTTTVTVKTAANNRSGKKLSYKFKVNVSGYVTSISTVKVDGAAVKNNGTYSMYIGSDDYAKVKAVPTVNVQGGASKSVTYSSSNKKVAAINSKGTISAKKAGTATIKVTSKAVKKNGKKATYSFKVRVYDTYVIATPVTSTLTRTGSRPSPTTRLDVEIKNLKSSTVNVTSSNTSVVSVKKNNSKNWTLTGKKAGTATLTVKASSGKTSFTYKVKITVKDQKATGITYTRKSSMSVGETYAINATVSGNPVVGGYTVSSSNTNVASVSGTTITARRAGTTTITVQTRDKAKRSSYTLTVSEVSEVLNITTASTLSGFTLEDINVSNAEYLLTKDAPALASAIGVVSAGQSVTVTVGTDTTLTAVYNADGTMTYYRNGRVLTPNADTFKDISVKNGETVTFPNNAKISEIITGMASAAYTTETYDVSCKVNGVTVSAANVKFSNGTITFTTEGVTYEAAAVVSGGNHTLVVTNKSNTSVKFSDTNLGKAMHEVGIY